MQHAQPQSRCKTSAVAAAAVAQLACRPAASGTAETALLGMLSVSSHSSSSAHASSRVSATDRDDDVDTASNDINARKLQASQTCVPARSPDLDQRSCNQCLSKSSQHQQHQQQVLHPQRSHQHKAPKQPGCSTQTGTKRPSNTSSHIANASAAEAACAEEALGVIVGTVLCSRQVNTAHGSHADCSSAHQQMSKPRQPSKSVQRAAALRPALSKILPRQRESGAKEEEMMKCSSNPDQVGCSGIAQASVFTVSSTQLFARRPRE